MYDSVRRVLFEFAARFEGSLPYMYLDFHHDPVTQKLDPLVTFGRGDLGDPLALVLGLPWRFKMTRLPASASVISAEWHVVKSLVPLAPRGGAAFSSRTSLYLEQRDLDALDLAKFTRIEGLLRKRPECAAYDTWPADAQLGILSMCWAMGEGRLDQFPHFRAAVAKGDWMTCAGPPGDASHDPGKRGQAWIVDTLNPGLRPRNLANKVLFQNAARVLARADDPSELYYPVEVGLEETKP